MKIKYWSNALNVIHTLSWTNFLDYDPHQDHSNNLKNEKMNNYDQIDYKNRDWTDDHDSMIPKYSQEFPRTSGAFKNRLHLSKPWG